MRAKIFFESPEALRYWADYIISPRFRGQHCYTYFVMPILKMFTPVSGLLKERFQFKGIEEKIRNLACMYGEYDKDVRLLGITGWRKTVFFTFNGKEKDPRHVFKIAEDEISMQRLIREKITLERMNEMDSHIPSITESGYLNGSFYLAERVLTGEPLLMFLYRHRKDEKMTDMIVQKSADLLIRMNKANSVMEKMSVFEKSDRLPLDFYINRLPVKKETAEKIKEAILKGIYNTRNVSMPLVIQHNDFQPENMLYHEGKILVLDWEYSVYEGLPLSDLFNFLLLTYGFVMKKRAFDLKGFSPVLKAKSINENIDLRTFHSVFYEENAISESVKKTVADYCKDSGIAKEIVMLLFQLFVIRHIDNDSAVVEFVFSGKEKPLFLK